MNSAERVVYEALRGSGYEVHRRGWPDFLVVRPDSSVFALEWKERGTRDFVSDDQERMHDALAIAGLDTLVTGSLADVFAYRPPIMRDAQLAAFRRIRSRLRDEVASLEREIRRLEREGAQ